MATVSNTQEAIGGLDELRLQVQEYGISDESDAVAICYGSTIRARSSSSDLDMLFVETAPKTVDKQQDFVASLIELHHRTGRLIDTEVPYDNKLFYSPAEIAESFAHTMFLTEDNDLCIPSLVGMQEGDPYFASHNMKLRLAFNAFTSAHLLLAGSSRFYTTLRESAQKSLSVLVKRLAEHQGLVVNDLATAQHLLFAPDGIHPKDFLGYYPEDTAFQTCLRQALRTSGYIAVS